VRCHCGNDALPLDLGDAPIVTTVPHDDRDPLVAAREEQHCSALRRGEERPLEEESLRARSRLGLGALVLKKQPCERTRKSREQRTGESHRKDRDRGDERRVRTGPVGPEQVARDDADRRERGTRRERPPA
jgi:hypothetical protein